MQDEYRIKKQKVPTNVIKAVEFAQESLRSADIPASTVPSQEVRVTAGGDSTGLVAELDRAQQRIVEIESSETLTVRRHEELLEKMKQHHAEEVNVWGETSAEIAESLINNGKVAKGDSIKMSVKKSLIIAGLERYSDVPRQSGTEGNVKGVHGED